MSQFHKGVLIILRGARRFFECREAARSGGAVVLLSSVGNPQTGFDHRVALILMFRRRSSSVAVVSQFHKGVLIISRGARLEAARSGASVQGGSGAGVLSVGKQSGFDHCVALINFKV